MNIKKVLKQAQQMQEKMQQELADTVVETSVGGGMVTLQMDGHKQLAAVRINPEVLDPEDPGMLEDLIVAAVNQAGREIDESMQEKMGSLTAGLPMPGLF